ncbi:MAG: hypothetical protein SF187_17485 [Deltaproteobacteria bacterium]|nr:hypothetical protein [Deltaproteobacteria bacterium]
MNNTHLDELLDELRIHIKLLLAHSEVTWARVLENLGNQAQNDIKHAASELLRLFGGMGSYNDLVLYEGGQVLTKANDELAAARNRLFQLCTIIKAA